MNLIKGFLIVCILSSLIGPALAEVTYTNTIVPESPMVGDIVYDYVDSSWAEKNKKSYMVFDWTQKSKKHAIFTQTVPFVKGEYYDYVTWYQVEDAGNWKIYYEEFNRKDESMGGGEPSDFVSFRVLEAPAFSSYTMVILSFVSIYFVLRKKIM